MSEYQYYDFRAIDRPLTSSQRAELGQDLDARRNIVDALHEFLHIRRF
jgi:hypothetical protein